MQVEVNGAATEVASARAAIESVGPHDELIVAHRRADGAVLQAAGSRVGGFVVEVDGGHTGRRTSASHAISATAVATMFDRFAAGDTGWPGPTVWADEATGASAATRSRGVIAAIILLIVSVVAAVLAVVSLRRYVTLPYLCGSDGRDVESVRFGGGGLDGRTDECVYAGGQVERMVDVAGALGWVEVVGSVVAMIVLWYVIAKLLARVAFR